MDNYENLLSQLKKNFIFIHFHNINYKINNQILLRHDIHLQDIENAYKMISIEKKLNIKATYFVQYNIPQERNNIIYQEKYIKFIKYCIKNNIEVQPHISPISGAFDLDKYLSKDINNIEKVKKNYILNRVDNYDEFIIIDDFLEIHKLNQTIIEYLNNYNNEWEKKFGFYPKGFSVHGDINFPKIPNGLNNKTLMNQKCFADIYEYIDRSHIILDKFQYISDTQYNINLFCPEKFKDNLYQILIHPAQWSGLQFETNLLTSKFGFTLQNIFLHGSDGDKRYLNGGFKYKKDDKWVNELIDKTELFTLDKKLSICDSGCGDGFWCEILNTHFDKVFGEDLSKGGIYMGIKNNIINKTNISYEYCNSLTNKKKYDIIFSRNHGLLCSTQINNQTFINNFISLSLRCNKYMITILQTKNTKGELININDFKPLYNLFEKTDIKYHGNNIIIISKFPNTNLKAYKDYLLFYKEKNFNFLNFYDFTEIDDKESIKENTIIIRHDIHLQDISNAYKMLNIEKSLGIRATYFVQYEKQCLCEIENQHERNNKIKYEDFINYCICMGVDVQPHIAFISSYIANNNFTWYNLSKSELVKKVNDTYSFEQKDYYHKINFKEGEDFIDLDKLTKHIINFLKNIRKRWKEKFNITPDGYSVHGGSELLQGKVSSNVYIDQKEIVESGIFKYTANSHKIYKYFPHGALTDNYFASWMFNHSFFYDNPKNVKRKYIVLIHPAQWSGIKFETNLLTSKFGFTLEDIYLKGTESDKRYINGGFKYKKDDKWVKELIDKTELFTLDKKLSICDSGCGDGFWCEILNTHFDKVIGEDLCKGGIYMGIKNNISNKTNISYEYCNSLTNKKIYDIIFSRHHGLLCSTQVFSPFFLLNFLKLALRGKINVHILLQKIYNKDEIRDISKYNILEKFFQNVKIINYQNNHILILKYPKENIIKNELIKLETIE